MSKRHKLARDKRNGEYYVRIQIGGKRKYFPLGKNRKTTEFELTRLERLYASGELSFHVADEEIHAVEITPAPPADAITLQQLADLHLEWIGDHRAPATCEQQSAS